MSTTIELSLEELKLLVKLLKRQQKWFRAYAATTPHTIDMEEWDLTNELTDRLEAMTDD